MSIAKYPRQIVKEWSNNSFTSLSHYRLTHYRAVLGLVFQFLRNRFRSFLCYLFAHLSFIFQLRCCWKGLYESNFAISIYTLDLLEQFEALVLLLEVDPRTVLILIEVDDLLDQVSDTFADFLLVTLFCSVHRWVERIQKVFVLDEAEMELAVQGKAETLLEISQLFYLFQLFNNYLAQVSLKLLTGAKVLCQEFVLRIDPLDM